MPDTIGICTGDSVLINFSEEQVGKNATIQWTTDYAIIERAKQIYLKRKGRYIVKIYDEKRTIVDTTVLVYFERPKVNVKDTFMCEGNPITIIPKNKTYTYRWSNGESSPLVKIEKPGKYWVTATYKGCSHTDTFRVSMMAGVTTNFGNELLICENETPKILSVRAPANTKFYWSTGAVSSYIPVSKEGVYWVKSTLKNCGTITDSVTVKYKNCECEMFIPNSFTPNEDDKNDVFSPLFQCEYSYFQLTIYDRWGNIVYLSNNVNGKWDGRFKGNPCPDDVYVYRIEAVQKNSDKKIIKNGHISLFR